MEKRIIVLTLAGEDELLNTLKHECCLECILKATGRESLLSKCQIDGSDKRVGFRSSPKACAYGCDNRRMTARNFSLELQNALDSSAQLIRFRKEVARDIQRKERERVSQVVHNIKTQNAHAIQELNMFIQEEQYTYQIQSVLTEVCAKVSKNTRQATYTLLRLCKIHTAMSDELFIYENIMHQDEEYKLKVRRYDIHDVLLLVFHEFMPDFKAKNVKIQIEPYDQKVYFDFRIVRFMFYHLIANTQKYTRPNSTVHVRFDETTSNIEISFDMESYHIYKEDYEKMFDEHYSGKVANEMGTAGKGLGMYLVSIVAKLHNARILVYPGQEYMIDGRAVYSYNIFKILIPKSL